MLYKWNISSIKISFSDEKEAKRLFEELPLHNALIKKPYIKHLNNIDLLCEPTFYNELNIVKTSIAFRGYTQLVNQVLKTCLKIY